MTSDSNQYIPALKYGWLTSIYDPLMAWTTRDSTFKRKLVEQAEIQSNHRVLDLGCGTGTLTCEIKGSYPEADVVGLDGDPKVLLIAKRKAENLGLELTLDRGMSFELPYPDNSFDRVLSSLLFHHLTKENKIRTLKEILRVLRPEGELHIADWGRARNPLMRAAFFQVQLLDGFETTSDNVAGLLEGFIRDAGFARVEETTHFATIYGTLALYRAKKSRNDGAQGERDAA